MTLGSQLNFASDQRGTLNYNLGTNIVDTAYITTSASVFGKSPYLFYFQISYDSTFEGPLALALYRYDKEVLTFEEV